MAFSFSLPSWSSFRPFRDDVEGGADGDVRGLDGGAIGVAGEALGLAVHRGPHGVGQLVVRARTQVAEDGQGRQRSQRDGAQQGVADQRAALDAGFLDDVVDDPDSGQPVLFGADGVALFRHFVVRHKGLGPVHDAGADTQHGKGGADAQQGVLQPDGGDRGVSSKIDGEVRHQEYQGANDRGAEQNGHLPFRSLGGPRVRVSQAQTMRGNSRILELLHLILTSRSYGARVVRTAVTMVAHNSPHPSLVSTSVELVFNSNC